MILPAYILILAQGIGGFRRLEIQLLVLAAVLCVNGTSLFNYYFDSRYSREDARAAAKYLETTAQSKDIIVVVGNSTAFGYYYKGNVPIETMNARGVEDHVLHGKLETVTQSRNRLWLVEFRPWEADPNERIKRALDKIGRPIDHRIFPGVTIYSYVH